MPIKRIISGLNDFQENYFKANQDFFEQLSQGQTPDILFITCCDSRIAPNLLTQTKPGELFIIRNMGNIIPPYGTLNSSEATGIEYAVQALNIKEIVICGHSHCGSIKGLLQLQSLSDEMPLVYDWLKHYGEPIRRIIRENYQEYSGEELLNIATQTNVLNQIANLETYPVVRSRLQAGKIQLHAWVYEIETGEILAYDVKQNQFVPLEQEPFPVPDPLSTMQPI
ncbi:carbonic anhydrase [Planktothrix sp. FACHB-1365]|uniref:carbonic anhydrase n=1 Tax=Planktothrix sp. FACHB-1365 TaxID=2692855 RepID=UPI0016838D11|nr:carbonic anhydrase [Planktothrix sp. FACHB-1365]MBD2485731.1 carbonic anhydrase [Planktothrix sp. FACHB-1365]